jgi:hypothetical protein
MLLLWCRAARNSNSTSTSGTARALGMLLS